MTKLLIKIKNKYICEKSRNELDFIHIPMYYPNNEAFSNLSIFITLLCTKHLSQDYGSDTKLNEQEWSILFEEYFLPEYLHQVDTDSFIYDLDELLKDYPSERKYYEGLISSLSFPLVLKDTSSLKNESEEEFLTEETKYDWRYPYTTVSLELETFTSKHNQERKDNDVLLLYSAGKDSTLSAIRIYNAGYNVHFIHFDNGHMRDTNKPYITYKNLFEQQDDYYFDYSLHNINISKIFKEYYSNWILPDTDPELTSEIRCLSCRMAMYTVAIQIAKEKGYKYIADGARISQKFMLEQTPMINRLKELAATYGIKLLFPVLYLEDDEELKEELISNGYSAKTWESKCLIGKAAKEKTEHDKKVILDYYDKELKPRILEKTKEYYNPDIMV